MLSKRYTLYCYKSQKMLLKFVYVIISHKMEEAERSDGVVENTVMCYYKFLILIKHFTKLTKDTGGTHQSKKHLMSGNMCPS